jgi:hypothetical protein
MAVFSPCSDLTTRTLKWVAASDNAKNGSRPSSYVSWGVGADSIAASYREAHFDADRKCPISGWRSNLWG